MEGIKMAINSEKRHQFYQFLETLKKDKKGMELSSLYGLYVAFVEDKSLIYSLANIRKMFEEDPEVEKYNTQKTDEVSVRMYRLKPILFDHLTEDTEEGEKARKLYRSMVIFKKNYDLPLKTVIKRSIEISKNGNIEDIKKSVRTNSNTARNELNKTINFVLKDLSAMKLLALSRIKQTYDTIKVSKKNKPLLDQAVVDAVHTIKDSISVDEIKVYQKKFDKELAKIKISKKEKQK
jgi:hypothetical protein